MDPEEEQLELLQEQLERRRKRGAQDLAKIVNQGRHPVYSTFEVISTSDRVYTVHIRSLTELLNTCTCPDYRTNTIGTCKHIEGVLINLEKEFADQWEAFIDQAPPVPQIFVRHAEQPTVRITLPLPGGERLRALLTRYFDPEGVLQGKVTQSLPALFSELNRLPTNVREQVHVAQDVHDHLKKQQDIEAVQQQRKWFLEQVDQGNRSLDVISTPLYGFQDDGVLHLTFGRRAMLADDRAWARRSRPSPPPSCSSNCATSNACSSSAPRRSSSSGPARSAASHRSLSRPSRATPSSAAASIATSSSSTS